MAYILELSNDEHRPDCRAEYVVRIGAPYADDSC